MGKIVILDEITSNQIAAGEVVERPASVVKELIENSMDAGATSITVEIKNGGIGMIRIIDNGCGIEDDDVEIAFERHATSKIRGPGDLDSIGTFGFRGEALASIASVSNIELLTRTADKDSGRLIRMSGGKVIEVSPAASQKGTSITVSELFFNTPARFKFLKKDTTEGGHVADIVTRIALGNPDIAFKFINNRNVAFQTPGNGDLLSAIFSIYGKETAKLVDKITYSSNGIKVTGYAGKAEIARASRTNQSFYINKRYIRSKVITASIDEAYKTVLMKNKYPFMVLLLEINPQMVDVNVHPQKMEVRFSDEQEIFRAVYNAVNNALLGRTKTEWSTPEKSSVKMFEMNPELKKNSYVQESIVVPQAKTSVSVQSPINKGTREVDNRPISSSTINYIKPLETIAPSFKLQEKAEKNVEEKQKDKQEEKVNERTIGQTPDRKNIENVIEEKKEEKVFKESQQEKVFKESQEEKITKDSQSEKTNEEPDDEPATVNPAIAWMMTDNWLYIGQVFQTFIIIQYDKEMFVIDQHAAHERIMFETLKKRYEKNESVAQMLLVPENINMTAKEAIFLKDKFNNFEKMGFLLEEFGQNTFLLRSVPFEGGSTIEPKELFLAIFDYYFSNYNPNRLTNLLDETLYQLACKSAVKANQRLSEIEVKALIKDLSKIENPHTCPHGRPTVLKMSKYEFEKLFKRIV